MKSTKQAPAKQTRSVRFEDFDIGNAVLAGVKDAGYVTPTPIQEASLPFALKGRDISASAKTGTGKTASFLLPIIQRLILNPQEKGFEHPRALVIAPTRELARQIGESFDVYASHTTLKSLVLDGGGKLQTQAKKIQAGVDVIIATPGRLIDLDKLKQLSLNKIEALVIDEADTIFDMGFIRDLEAILALLPEKHQTMLFSATFPPVVKRLSEDLLKNPEHITVDRLGTTADEIKQVVYSVDKDKKSELLSYMIGVQNWQQVLVFTRTKVLAQKIEEDLIRDGLSASSIHGDKKQGARTKALNAFKEGKFRVLVATDIAARGLDIENLPYVVNYDLPKHSTEYIHRVGRTGRAGSKGLAVSFVSPNDEGMLKNIEQLLRKPIPQRRIKGYEPDKRTEGKQRHFEGNKDEKIRGAFGHKKKKTPAASKKTTKRNGGAAAAKKVDDQRKQSASRSKKRK
jgi:ATP-dependent RNA helicase RhlE